MVQIVDLDEEALAEMSDDERELVEAALANEEENGCLTEAQASRAILVVEADDEEDLEEERRLHRKVHRGLLRGGGEETPENWQRRRGRAK